LSFIGSQGLY